WKRESLQFSPVMARPPTSTSPVAVYEPRPVSAAAGAAAMIRMLTTATARCMRVSSPREGEAGRVVRSVDLLVAVLARAAEQELGARHPRLGRVARLDVAGLAESRSRHLEHVLAQRPVRVVAVHAVLDDRRVLPEERTALVGVARVA